MSIRLDPRRLAALKLLAGEAGLRPGELVTWWVEERLDAARSGAVPAGRQADALAELRTRVDELAARIDALATTPSTASETAAGTSLAEPSPAETATPRRRPGRPRKTETAPAIPGPRRIPLHEEIAAVIAERGPQTAAELASAIVERGRYSAPRSARPLDAATVNSRVSNPAYRDRFVRRDGRIHLADAG